MSGKVRLDQLLVNKGLFPSREKAKSAIMAGIIKVEGNVIDKAGTDVIETAAIEVVGPTLKYVSRGGLKLEKALQEFPITLTDLVVADIGASTGGFTDCALQNGARKVYSIDVGYGQLDWKLRNDNRVVNLERTNFRYLDVSVIEDIIDFATVDVAFISLEKILPKLSELVKLDGKAIVLIKPQFEAGRDKVGKKGVVRDKEVHKEVITNVLGFAELNGFKPLGLTYSPIKGPEGNIEYLLFLERVNMVQSDEQMGYEFIDTLVEQAFHSLI